MSELRVNTITEASTGTGITFTNSIVSGNFGTITQRNSSSSSPTFTRSSGTAIDSTVLGNLYGATNVQPNDSTNTTHAWIAWDYGSGNARKLTKLQWYAVDGAGNSAGIFLEGSNVASPNAGAGHSDWTQLKAFGNVVNGSVYSYSSPVTATTLKYRHYRIRWAWSSGNYNSIHSFVLEDTDSTFDARTALNAVGTAPIYACRAWVNFNGTGTVAIRASANVSSITDNGTGDYTVNFTTAMPDAKYCISGAGGRDSTGGGERYVSIGYLTTTSFRYWTHVDYTQAIDAENVCASVFR